MYSIIRIERQQGITEYFYKPVKIVFIQCDVNFFLSVFYYVLDCIG